MGGFTLRGSRFRYLDTLLVLESKSASGLTSDVKHLLTQQKSLECHGTCIILCLILADFMSKCEKSRVNWVD